MGQPFRFGHLPQVDVGGGRLRLFAAVDVPDRQKASVEAAIGPLKAVVPGARWTSPATWHVTLKFFGEVPEAWLEGILNGIGQATDGAKAVESRLMDIGAFPNPRRARVLWVGIDDSTGALAALAEAINRECVFVEDRPLHTHLTLARLRTPADVGPVMDRFSPFELDPAPFVIDRVTLFRSYTERTGSRYQELGSWPLSPGESL